MSKEIIISHLLEDQPSVDVFGDEGDDFVFFLRSVVGRQNKENIKVSHITLEGESEELFEGMCFMK